MRRRLLQLTAIAIPLCATAAHGLEPTRAAEGVSYGPMPASSDDWQGLADQGIRTVVGVDGLPPDRVAAESHGLRVVHIPLGYDGIGKEDSLRLAAAARQAERPLYVFCHHGRHRGPAAAAIICRTAGLLDAEGSIRLLHDAGTSTDYRGLWRDVASFTPPADDTPLPTLVAQADVSPLALAMTQLDRGWEAYQIAEDVSSRSEALVTIREALHESRRAVTATQADPGFMRRLEAVRALSEELEELTVNRAHLPRIEKSIEKSCVECHRRYRD